MIYLSFRRIHLIHTAHTKKNTICRPSLTYLSDPPVYVAKRVQEVTKLIVNLDVQTIENGQKEVSAFLLSGDEIMSKRVYSRSDTFFHVRADLPPMPADQLPVLVLDSIMLSHEDYVLPLHAKPEGKWPSVDEALALGETIAHAPARLAFIPDNVKTMMQNLKVHSSNVRCKETIRRSVAKPKDQKGSKAKNEDNAKTAKKQIVKVPKAKKEKKPKAKKEKKPLKRPAGSKLSKKPAARKQEAQSGFMNTF